MAREAKKVDKPHNHPIKKFRAGLVEGVVWLNKRVDGDTEIEFKSATIRKSWKDKDNRWREEKINLRKQDISKLIVVLNKLQEELLLSEQEDEGDEDE